MHLLVPFSYYIYVMLFVVCQQIVGIRSGARNIKRHEYPSFIYYVALSQVLITVGIIRMAGESFNNLTAIRTAGFAVVITGLAISMWAQRTLGKYWVGGIALHGDHKLIMTGPYKYVRHPLYSGMLVSGTGLCLVSLNVFYGLGSLVFTGAYALRAIFEDDLLRKRFKKRYAKYATETGAIFPRLRK
jgi:protein-S-isoprenylcysteine O-methyltransferase Ste14